MFRVGQKIVCVDDSAIAPDCAPYLLTRPKKGEIYTVASIQVEPDMEGYGVRLEELPNPSIIWSDLDEKEWSFDAKRFRPLVEQELETAAEIGPSST